MRNRRNELITNFFMTQILNIFTETGKEIYKRIATYNVNTGKKIIEKNTHYFINLTKDNIQSVKISIKIPLQIENNDLQKHNYINFQNKYPANILGNYSKKYILQ